VNAMLAHSINFEKIHLLTLESVMHFLSFGEPVFYIIVGKCPERYRLRLEGFPGLKINKKLNKNTKNSILLHTFIKGNFISSTKIYSDIIKNISYARDYMETPETAYGVTFFDDATGSKTVDGAKNFN
jgi:hypothetical protein